MTDTGRIHGQNTADTWPKYGRYTAKTWEIHGKKKQVKRVAHALQIHVRYVTDTRWITNGAEF